MIAICELDADAAAGRTAAAIPAAATLSVSAIFRYEVNRGAISVGMV